MLEKIEIEPILFTGSEEIVVVPLFEGTDEPRGPLKLLDVACAGALRDQLRSPALPLKQGETLFFTPNRPGAPRYILLVGMGDRGAWSVKKLMDASGKASRALFSRRFSSCRLLPADCPRGLSWEEYLFVFLKGFLLARYRYSKKTGEEEKDPLEELVVLSSRDRRATGKVVSRALTVARHTMSVRDMVNAPSNEMTPGEMARTAKDLARRSRMECRIISKAEMEKKGFSAVLAVSRGSAQTPRIIVLHYNRGRSRQPLVCLVGKGVTFDSGGISLKPWNHMEEMKGDMAGGALVMHAMAAAAESRLPLRITGVIPCVENMPGGTALKPGDVVKTYAGKTIEIISTDAEGRLILADAIAYAKELDPMVIVDFATLTGACVVALGKSVAGVIGNNQTLVNLLLDAGRRSGEPLWQLPLDESFSEMLKGDIADYKNYSGKDGSTITAAALLGQFAEGKPWGHLDIAGPFWSDSGSNSYLPKGGTGFGVDLVLRFLEAIVRNKKLPKKLGR